MGRGSSNDSAWQHGERINGNPSHVRCKFCRHTMWGGISRFKQHLAQTGGDVIACSKCPLEVTLEFKESIINRMLDVGERKRQRRDLSENVRNTEVEVHQPSQEGGSNDDYDAKERALIEQAIQESLKTNELESKKAKMDEAEFEAACHESMRSYHEELQRRGEGCSHYNGGSSYAGYESTYIDLDSDSDFSL